VKVVDVVTLILLMFGGLTWGTVGLADYNVIMWVFIAMHNVQHFIYLCIGASALWWIFSLKHIRRRWAPKKW
jgi:uncharacterized protein